jgi:hypothetical protein
MNINKIFSLFSSSEEPEKKVTEVKLSDSPVIWIKMFKKLIINYETFSKQMIQFFKLSDPPLDTDEIERASSYMVYERAYEQLAKLDLQNKAHLDCIYLHSDDDFKATLHSALGYYETQEEYEKCAFIKQILDISNFS